MEVSLNDIKYGNPTLEQMSLVARQSMLDDCFVVLSQIPPPSNDSEIIQKELSDLVEYTSQLAADQKLANSYRVFDYDTEITYKKSLVSAGADRNEMSAIIESVLNDIRPVIYRLKFQYLRSRPNQVSIYYRLKLFPFESHTIDSPSYPSAHACEAKVLSEILGNLSPDFYQSYQKMAKNIAMSRVYMGLNYQTDVDMGFYCAECFLSDRNFKVKYGI